MQALRSASKTEQRLQVNKKKKQIKNKKKAYTKIEKKEAFRDHGNLT